MWEINDILGLLFIYRKRGESSKKKLLHALTTPTTDPLLSPVETPVVKTKLRNWKHFIRHGLPKTSHGARTGGAQGHSGRWEPKGSQKRSR